VIFYYHFEHDAFCLFTKDSVIDFSLKTQSRAAAAAAGGRRRVVFGDGSATGLASEMHWAYVKFDLGQLANCHWPFADADGDGDVDQQDFAEFQRCLGSTSGLPEGSHCQCFDQFPAGNPDGQIDVSDYVLFARCGSGPGIAADPACQTHR
jgi:hypothetical protein